MAERPQPRVAPKSSPAPGRGSSLTAEWHGLPMWAWAGIGTVTLVGGFLFIRRFRAAKAAASTTPTATAGSGFGSGAISAGNLTPLPAGTNGGGTTSGPQPGQPVPAGSPIRSITDTMGGVTTLFSGPTDVNSYTPPPSKWIPAYVGADAGVPPVYIGPYSPATGGLVDFHLQPTSTESPGSQYLGPGALDALRKLSAQANNPSLKL